MSSELSPTLQLACDLIRRKSVTPLDAGCQDTMMARLEKIGFVCTRLRFDDVDNFWAVHGSSGPILCFAGHTDVVPAGEESHWQHAPYEPVIRDGMLYGRGAADMKGSLAAMVIACENFLTKHPDHHGRITFLITSDEEGIALNGTVKVVEYLEQHNEKITWCVVGEPTSTAQLGDVIKNGRRGSLSGSLKVRGIQGHVAYPQLARNPIHDVAPALAALAAQHWDNGNDFFPPTTFQISNFNAGTGAGNVIPGDATIEFNFRFSTEVTPDQLKQRVTDILGQHKLDYQLQWILGGQPFLTQPAELVQATVNAIRDVTGITAQLSTTGGTSDGRFIAPTGAQVIELGPVNSTIHKVNECASATDIEQLALIYTRIIDNLLGDK